MLQLISLQRTVEHLEFSWQRWCQDSLSSHLKSRRLNSRRKHRRERQWRKLPKSREKRLLQLQLRKRNLKTRKRWISILRLKHSLKLRHRASHLSSKKRRIEMPRMLRIHSRFKLAPGSLTIKMWLPRINIGIPLKMTWHPILTHNLMSCINKRQCQIRKRVRPKAQHIRPNRANRPRILLSNQPLIRTHLNKRILPEIKLQSHNHRQLSSFQIHQVMLRAVRSLPKSRINLILWQASKFWSLDLQTRAKTTLNNVQRSKTLLREVMILQ